MNSSTTGWAWPWWSVIVAINVINLIVCVVVFQRSKMPKDGMNEKYRRRMRMMGLIFALVSAYRSVFPSRYFSQMAWFDSVLNSSLLIRSFAIFAELSFAGLFGLAMLQLNRDLPDENLDKLNGFQKFMTTKTPYILIGSLFVAQFFATSGLIMKSNVLFAIEESLWSLGFVSILPLAIIQLRRVYAVKDSAQNEKIKMFRVSSVIVAAWAVIYCCYGLLYHLPFENWAYAVEQMQTGVPAMKTGLGAIKDAFLIVNESKAYGDWGFGFLLWHSAYFSVCTWIAIALMRAPRLKNDKV